MIPDDLPAKADATRKAATSTAAEAFVMEQDGLRLWRGFDPDAVGTQVFLARVIAEPGTRIPPHVHSVDTVAYLAGGKAVFRSGDQLEKMHEMLPGDWLFVPAGLVHVEETPDDSDADFVYARDRRGGVTTYVDADDAK